MIGLAALRIPAPLALRSPASYCIARSGVALVLLLASCESASEPPAPHSASSNATPSPRATRPPEPSSQTPATSEELDRITEEDYEEDAVIDISADNLEAELDRLEREISP